MRGDIIIENVSLKDFLMDLLKNLERREVSTASLFFKKFIQAWRFISNYNFPGKVEKNVEAHYDVGGKKGEYLYDVMLG